MQPFRTRVFNSAKVAATSLPPGARAAAIDTRVSASQTLTINGGAQARPRSEALRRDFPSTATTPRGAPRSKPSRIAPTKLASALASSAGSSRRNSRLKQSWLGAMRQVDDLGQLGRVDRPEVGDVDTALLAAQRRRQRDEQDSRQLMARIWGARIAHLAQDRQHRLHRGSLKPGNPLRINFIPLATAPLRKCDSPGDWGSASLQCGHPRTAT